MTVAGPNKAFVVHQGRQVQGLAAFAGTGVPPRLARLRRARVPDELRGEVLNFEHAFGELRRAEKILLAHVAKRVGNGVLGFGF
jgi:hypothetical protein